MQGHIDNVVGIQPEAGAAGRQNYSGVQRTPWIGFGMRGDVDHIKIARIALRPGFRKSGSASDHTLTRARQVLANGGDLFRGMR